MGNNIFFDTLLHPKQSDSDMENFRAQTSRKNIQQFYLSRQELKKNIEPVLTHPVSRVSCLNIMDDVWEGEINSLGNDENVGWICGWCESTVIQRESSDDGQTANFRVREGKIDYLISFLFCGNRHVDNENWKSVAMVLLTFALQFIIFMIVSWCIR